jgi:ABC-2 type transport system ATP-binding protein
LLHKSQKILDGKTKDLLNSYRTNTYQIEFTGDLDLGTSMNSIPEAFSLISTHSRSEYSMAIFTIHTGTVNDLIAFLIPHISIVSLKEKIPTIQDIFIKMVQD